MQFFFRASRTTFILCIVSMGIVLSAQTNSVLRFPDLDDGGSRLTFVYQGDIWVADRDGDKAQRLTVHEAYDERPRWNHAGTKISFSSDRNGHSDIFEIDMSDLSIRRRTYFDSEDIHPAWDGKDQTVFCTQRAFVQIERQSEVFGFEGNNATPNRVLNALVVYAEPSYDMDHWALVQGYCRESREEYRGPANRNVVLYDGATNAFRSLTEDQGQDIMVRWSEEHIYVLSARSGTYNLYRRPIMSVYESDWEQVTAVGKPGIRYFDVSKDGQTIAYERAGGIYVVSNGKDAKRFEPVLPRDRNYEEKNKKTFTSGISHHAISPNGKRIALEIGGEIFVKSTDEKLEECKNVSQSDFMDQKPQWLNDSTVLFISDRSGQEEVYRAISRDEGVGDLLYSFEVEVQPILSPKGIIDDIVLSPKRDNLILTREPGILEIAPVDTNGDVGDLEVVLSGWDMPSGVCWSPRGDWISYSLSDLDFNEEVYICHHKDRRPINVSMHPREDKSPVWSPDGTKLAFLSERNNGDADVWMVWLSQKDYETAVEDFEHREDYPKEWRRRLGMVEEDSAQKEVTLVDELHIYRRLKQLTSHSGDEGSIAFDGNSDYLYYTTPGLDNEKELRKVSWTGKNSEKVAAVKGVYQFIHDPKGKSLYFIEKGKSKVLNTGKDKIENRPHKAVLVTNQAVEREQVFEEAFRQIRANFYDPDFHGQDLESLKRQYENLCLSANKSEDFRYYFNEMLGQINASHMGLYDRSTNDVDKESSGSLGAEFEYVEGGLKIVRVLPEGPLDRNESMLEAGDVVVSINGKSISADINAYELLMFKEGERVRLDALGPAGGSKTVYPRCLGSQKELLYKEWVQERKKLVERYSHGKLGYIHIRGMNWTSFEQFERELMASGYGKEGILIDVRYNGGGWTTDMLMAVLQVRQHAYTVPRGAAGSLNEHDRFEDHYPYGERLPLSWWTKPAAALCNSYSYSNAEIFSHAFRNLGRGPLVGEPTFGAVISTGGKSLKDGSWIRLPFRGWFVKTTGENMDFTPAVPDYVVPSPLGKSIGGEDEQLRKAVEVLLDGDE